MPLRARSVVGLLPLAAVTTLGPATMARLPDFMPRVDVVHRPTGPRRARSSSTWSPTRTPGWRMLSIVDEDRLRRILAAMLDPAEFLSDHGLRALSRYHAGPPARRRPSTA